VSLSGRVALVTGASSGIGKAIALGLASQGVGLALVGRNRASLDAVAVQALPSAGRVVSYQIDLAQLHGIEPLREKIQQDLGCVDILVHSAGIFSRDPIETASAEDFDEQYRTNVRAPFVLTQVFLPLIKASKGQVVFMNSTAGLRAGASLGQYAATKHALKALADSFRDEVNPHGVSVLSVFLGRTATPMQAAVHRMEGRAYCPERLMQPGDVASIVISALSLPRTAEVTDISIRPRMKLS
jgi:NAD(P)-dependent dehydrogenase (short-subunit alcohol dehydrogenase family)